MCVRLAFPFSTHTICYIFEYSKTYLNSSTVNLYPTYLDYEVNIWKTYELCELRIDDEMNEMFIHFI